MIHFDADSLGEKVLRRFAGGTSRRGILARLGTALVAAPLFPVLPVSRANAAGNPLAVYREPMTVDDYLDSKLISDPLCLYDCDVPVDGSVAVVVSALDATGLSAGRAAGRGCGFGFGWGSGGGGLGIG